jgi:ferredoxin-NADP reductase
LFDTDNALAPTILYVSGGCGVTPVAGGNLWYSQGAGADSYQVDNSGIIISTFPC